nr:MAG TPA: hypothetical protein [Caudoviricetes sp.]
MKAIKSAPTTLQSRRSGSNKPESAFDLSILAGKAKRFIPQLFVAMSLCGVTPLIILWLMWHFGFAPALLVAVLSAAVMIHWINQTEPESR